MMNTLSTMPIYEKNYIWNELKAVEKDEGPLSVEDLVQLDQLHYLGTDAIDHAASFLEVTKESHILDVGSGLGGPARYLSAKYGCQVTGVELQEDLYENSLALTKRCGLDHKIQFIQGDFTQLSLSENKFDGLMSFLVVLHIRDKSDLFSRCAQALREGGRIYVEDFFIRNPLLDSEKTELLHEVGCSKLQTAEEYLDTLKLSGFVGVRFEDVTDLWSGFVSKRFSDLQKVREGKIRVHGQEAVTRLLKFYGTMNRLFLTGNLGGVRISGCHKIPPESC